MWKLCVDDDENNRTVVKLVRDEYTLGRADSSRIRLTERNISRNHARLVRAGGAWALHDLGSFNGASVNGSRIKERAALKHGDLIQLGDYNLFLHDDSVSHDLPPEAGGAHTRGARLGKQVAAEDPDRLVVIEGPNVGTRYALADGSVLLGRGEECGIALPDTSVSRVHAEIIGTASGYELIDLGSSNGIRVNGIQLERTFLHPSDVIELGDVLLKFTPHGKLDNNTSPGGRPSPTVSLAEDAQVQETAPPRRTALYAAGAIVALAAVLFLVFAEEGNTETTSPIQSAASPASQLLSEAKRLLDNGDITNAHEKLEGIPSDSNLRDAPDFRAVESRWAETMFDTAEQTTDEAAKKAILNEIASARGVDSAQRKRAAEALAMLASGGMHVSELPAEARPQRPAPADDSSRGGQPAVPQQRSVNEPAGIVRKSPF